jgi:hypothetical protein
MMLGITAIFDRFWLDQDCPRGDNSRSSSPWAQRCQLRGCAIPIRAPSRGGQDRSKVSIIRPAGRTANRNLCEMFYEFSYPAQIGTGC